MAEIEGVLQDSFDELTDSRLRKLLQNKGNPQTMAERIIDAINQGALDNETLKSVFADSLGLPSLDDDTIFKLVDLAKKGRERRRLF